MRAVLVSLTTKVKVPRDLYSALAWHKKRQKIAVPTYKQKTFLTSALCKGLTKNNE